MQALSPLSTEYIRVPVQAMGYTLDQIKACSVAMAMTPFGYEPLANDWYTATWAEGSVAYALLLVGPGANINLAPRTSYDVWVKITTPAPVAPATTPPSYVAVFRAGTFRTSGAPSTEGLPTQYDQRAKTLNLGATLGDDLVLTFRVTEAGALYVWTGATLEGQIRMTDTSPVVLTTFTLTPTVAGSLRASLTDSQIEALGAGTFYYSIRITKNAITRTWVKGALVITPAATQDS